MSFFPLQYLTLELNKRSLPFEYYKPVLDDFFNLFGMFIQIGGDPLEYEDFDKILSYAVENKVNSLAVRLNRLSRSDADFLKSNGVTAVLFYLMSLDGMKHDKVYGSVSSYEDVIESIDNANDAGIDLEIGTFFTKYNLDEFDALVEFSKNSGAKLFLAQRPCLLDMHGISYDRISNAQYKELILHCEKENLAYKGTGFKIVMGHCPHKILVQKDLSSIDALGGCSAGLISCVISTKGDVIPCLPLLDFKEGNIKENSLKSIWTESEIFTKLRDRSMIKGFCSRCDHLKLCGGCRADAYADTGDLFEEDPTCWLPGEK